MRIVMVVKGDELDHPVYVERTVGQAELETYMFGPHDKARRVATEMLNEMLGQIEFLNPSRTRFSNVQDNIQ